MRYHGCSRPHTTVAPPRTLAPLFCRTRNHRRRSGKPNGPAANRSSIPHCAEACSAEPDGIARDAVRRQAASEPGIEPADVRYGHNAQSVHYDAFPAGGRRQSAQPTRSESAHRRRRTLKRETPVADTTEHGDSRRQSATARDTGSGKLSSQRFDDVNISRSSATRFPVTRAAPR